MCIVTLALAQEEERAVSIHVLVVGYVYDVSVIVRMRLPFKSKQ